MVDEKPFFMLVSDYDDENLLPQRGTALSAGYDFVVAEDVIIPSYYKMSEKFMMHQLSFERLNMYTIEEVSKLTKEFGFKPTLVPTGVKAYIPKDEYLQLSVRSSCPLKNWLILANGVGIIDADYYNNPNNEGHIYFQIINLFPEDIILHKGDKIGQGVFLKYDTTIDDHAIEKRSGGFGSTSK